MPRNRQGGQSLVETALTLPILLLLALGVADIGRAFYYREAAINAARQAVRLAVARSAQSTGDAACAGNGATHGSVTLTDSIPGTAGNAITNIATDVALESSGNGAASGSAIRGGTLTMTFHCNNTLAVTNTTNGGITDPFDLQSDAVAATVAFPLTLVTPAAYPFTGRIFTLTITQIGRSEY